MTIPPLQGKRILIVEDEFFVAAVAEDMLADAGAIAVGPAATVPAALALAESEPLDAALIDLNLAGVESYPVIDALQKRGVPLILATGYGAAIDARDAPVLDKPYTREALVAKLSALLA